MFPRIFIEAAGSLPRNPLIPVAVALAGTQLSRWTLMAEALSSTESL
jgi:hypothetical protein